MKKIFILSIVLLFIFASQLRISGSESSSITSVYGECDNSEYYENSKEFVFENSMLENDKIIACFNQISLFDNYILELVYNIYGETQYLLIESTGHDYQAYIIYDFMIEEAIEYSCTRISDWSSNSECGESLKVYFNLNSKFYVKNDALFDLNNIYICDIDVENYFVERLNFSDKMVALSEWAMNRYNNKLISSEYDIENAFFFKNFQIDDENNFNNYGSCAVVAAALLLSYYDVFYDDSIIATYESYDGITYLTQNRVAKKLVDYANDADDFIDNFYIDLWDSTDYQLYYPNEITNPTKTNYVAPAGPSKGFHDYLVEIAIDKGYLNNGMTVINTENLISDFLSSKNITNLSTCRELGRRGIISVLETNTPVIIGMTGYSYFYMQNETLVGKKDELDCSHEVVAYGYQDTSIGLFFHVNMGWPTNNNDKNYFNDTYVSAQLMGYYTYLDSTNLEHVCGNHYMLYNDENSLYIEICTCESFEDNFYFISSTSDYDSVNYDGHVNPIKIEHSLDNYEVYNENQHLKKCRLYNYCGKSELENHNYVIIGSSNDSEHYIKCKDCGYTKYESHIDSTIRSNVTEHYKYCSYCLEEYAIEEHYFIYSGTDESHTGICRECEYEISTEEHIVTINNYNNSKHQYLCNCGYERFENHSFDDNLICTVCGFEHLTHTYLYSKYSSSKHLKYCLCGEQIYESHSFNIGILGNTCKHCGYFTKDLVTIDSTIGDVEVLEYDANNILYLEIVKETMGEEDNEY